MEMRYEFFSWRGFFVGAATICVALVVQSFLGFPAIWAERGTEFAVLIALTGLVVGKVLGIESTLLALDPIIRPEKSGHDKTKPTTQGICPIEVAGHPSHKARAS